MKLSSITNVDRNNYIVLGLTQGISVQSINAFRQIVGDVKGLFGARQKNWEKKFIKARQQALEEMVANAKSMGADEVIAVNIDVSELSGYITFIADGTAVKLRHGSKSKSKSGGARKSKNNKSKRHYIPIPKRSSKSKSGGGRKSKNRKSKRHSKRGFIAIAKRSSKSRRHSRR